MALSVTQNKSGPLWPLGLITVTTPGTPVGIMSLVDTASLNAPETATGAGVAEYASAQAYDIIITPVHSVGPVVANTGAIYVVLYSQKTLGSGNKADPGVQVLIIPSASGPVHLAQVVSYMQSKFDPYQVYIDADTASDGALVTLVI